MAHEVRVCEQAEAKVIKQNAHRTLMQRQDEEKVARQAAHWANRLQQSPH